jgi:hypothetical protein
MCADEYRLGTLESQAFEFWASHFTNLRLINILKVEFESFFETFESLIFSYAEAGNVNIKTLGNPVLVFLIYD